MLREAGNACMCTLYVLSLLEVFMSLNGSVVRHPWLFVAFVAVMSCFLHPP